MPTPTYTFTAGTIIESAKVNANFLLFEDCLDLGGGTLTGTLNTLTVQPSSSNAASLGSSTREWTSVFARSFKLFDTDASNYLNIVLGNNLAANKTLTLEVAADYALAITGDSTINGAAYVLNGTDVALADGGTGASLADPGADRIMFWDDSGSAVDWLTVGSGLSITGTTISASGSGGDVSSASTIADNRVVRGDGGVKGVQQTGVTVDDSDNLSGVTQLTYGTTNVFSWNTKSVDTAYLAASDGFVVVNITTGGGDTGSLQINTDASNPPTTFRTIAAAGGGTSGSAMSPVKKGDYYKVVTNTTGGAPVYTVYWVPVGTAG